MATTPTPTADAPEAEWDAWVEQALADFADRERRSSRAMAAIHRVASRHPRLADRRPSVGSWTLW